MAFIRANPGLTLRRGLQKVWIAFSPRFSPAKAGAFQMVYFVSYFPVLVLACVGAWRTRRQWRELGYIYVLIVAFALGSAVLWAHTSHRMYVEPYLMILAAAAFTGRANGTSGRAWGNAVQDRESSARREDRAPASLPDRAGTSV
jgi:cation transport ATPase